MDIAEYHRNEREKERIADLMRLVPSNIERAIDIGARDGFISEQLAERFSSVAALDLQKPVIDHPRINCVKGDVTDLDFQDASFGLVLCTEVLEHIPGKMLIKACNELSRISSRYVLIGVPNKQDIRVGRTTCQMCKKKSPPWGHVNSFDENRLQSCFPEHKVVKKSFVGIGDTGTNSLACLLMDMAGNPYGTYDQDEPCVHCGAVFTYPPKRSLLERVFTRASVLVRNAQAPFLKSHPNWIHILFEK